TNSGELGLKHFDAGIERFEPFAAALDLRLPFLPASRGQGLTDPLRLLASTEPLDEGGLDLGQRPLDLLALPLPLEAFEKVVHLGGARLLQAASALGPGCLHRGPVSIELTLDLLEALLELGEPVCPPGLLPHPLLQDRVTRAERAEVRPGDGQACGIEEVPRAGIPCGQAPSGAVPLGLQAAGALPQRGDLPPPPHTPPRRPR